ncbi:MAG TPA: hypothetical protein VK420_07680, partial [Longimicrobium sp.]|nr:hypothetical protein [Longimicrobium sp.]
MLMRCGKGHGSGAGECSIASPAAGGNRGGTGNGERGTVGSRAVPVPRFFALLAALVLAACKEEGGELPILKRIPLPEPVSATATLTTDSAGRVWVGDAGRLTVLDTLGRVAARIPVAGAPARVLRMRGSRLYVTRGPRDLAVVDAGTGRILAERRARRAGPVVIDPMARWAFTTGRWGGVLGMDTLLVTRWGWPEAGSEAGALAISPLGDRVYLAVNGDDDRSPAVQVRDAYSGRVLSSWEPPAPVRGLEAASDGRLYGWDDDGVFALRHVAGGLTEVWRVSPGLERIEALRVSPSGARVAVLARGEGGG